MSWNLLERFLESEHFKQDTSLCIQYLSRYADHVGIQYALCSKLRQFTYEELEFSLPQLCQLLVSVDNESMALEEFIMDLCEESANAALLTFWLFQTYLHDLSSNPQSEHFRTCSRIYNKIQRIIFGAADSVHREKIKTNILPMTVLASLILASVATPFLPRHAGPLAIAQARRPRPLEDVISEAGQESKLARSHTVSGSGAGGHPKPGRRKAPAAPKDIDPARVRRKQAHSASASTPTIVVEQSKAPVHQEPVKAVLGSSANPPAEPSLSSTSLPDTMRPVEETKLPTPPASAGLPRHGDRKRRHTHSTRPVAPSTVPREQKIRMLRSNYFRSQTAFLTALMDISNRLVNVAKPARLSALRAELGLIAQDLPAEVDIPVICPATLEEGAASNSKHHRIVRLNPAEATSLNSAERVPYLLMVEVIREDFDFNPDSEENSHLLSRLLTEKGPLSRRLFDLTDSGREQARDGNNNLGEDSVLEPAEGDLGNAPLINNYPYSPEEELPVRTKSPLVNGVTILPAGRSSSGATGRSSMAGISTPRSSHTEISRNGSPAPRKATTTGSRSYAPDQPDVSALATHMRTAAQMLAQLDQSSSKRPKQEVAAIKAKIIASMQSLEEQSFLMDDPTNPPTFDTIMAKSDTENPDVVQGVFDDENLDTDAERTINSGAGAARMENDQITGGVKRKGDRDDPSAATFGEDWEAKKDRIRRSSPYGWMKNWDLISVIVKTGADLRQEAFACQLIRVCSKIWTAVNVPVWVKNMRILVTGESSGLIETITNGVSLHSLKRSLTLANIAAGTNSKKRIATLKDHFVKTFGEPETEAYNTAVEAFSQSLAAYSVISYVLQLKDRHNGNLLIDNSGHIIHIDFGFMLSNSPGSMGFEAAPFKLTYEYIDVLGGMTSPAFDSFKKLCKQAFQALRKDAEKLISLVEIMGRQSAMPCFASGGHQAVNALRARFVLHLSREEAETFVEELIQKSAGSYYTRLYDTFQYRSQGIY
ncbi:phosphatidylinositol 3 [Microthyrium microscopicum]|uniref:1-phosphatidylinositol 4-kinase n=1 Tax=Microthyrium microscopicum TaxID=703497 RepID=A0A6A6USW7_9PEZI|nr:phosphatidylinositol 3 [Microthyrium microscopicum]